MTLRTILTACALFAITNTNTYGAWTFSDCKSKCNNDTCHNKDLKQECSDNCNKLVIGDCLNTPESNSQQPKPSPKASGVPTKAEDAASKLGSAVQGAANTGAQSAEVGSQDVPNAQQNINRPPRRLPPRPPQGGAASTLPSEPQRTASSDSKVPSQPSTSSLLGSHRKLPSKNLGEQGKAPITHGASKESVASDFTYTVSELNRLMKGLLSDQITEITTGCDSAIGNIHGGLEMVKVDQSPSAIDLMKRGTGFIALFMKEKKEAKDWVDTFDLTKELSEDDLKKYGLKKEDVHSKAKLSLDVVKKIYQKSQEKSLLVAQDCKVKTAQFQGWLNDFLKNRASKEQADTKQKSGLFRLGSK